MERNNRVSNHHQLYSDQLAIYIEMLNLKLDRASVVAATTFELDGGQLLEASTRQWLSDKCTELGVRMHNSPCSGILPLVNLCWTFSSGGSREGEETICS